MCCWPRDAFSAPASSPSNELEQVTTYDEPSKREAARAAARELDYDRYLAALLAPAHARDGLMALAAFHGEIARIPLTVREPGVGDIRLQWWRDALATPAGIATGNPVADAMRDVVRTHALPIDTLVGMIDAYGLELETGALTTGAAVDAHAAATQGATLLLAAQIAGCADPSTHPLLHAAGRWSSATSTAGRSPSRSSSRSTSSSC